MSMYYYAYYAYELVLLIASSTRVNTPTRLETSSISTLVECERYFLLESIYFLALRAPRACVASQLSSQPPTAKRATNQLTHCDRTDRT